MRSPKDGLTPAEVISYALMKTGKGEVCVVVEGSKDRDAFTAVLRRPPAHCLPVRGKESVLEVAQRLAATGKRTVIAIVDADEHRALGGRPEVGCDVFLTDHRDLESMLFFSSAGERLIGQLFDADTVATLERNRSTTMQGWVARQVAVYGAARVVNTVQDLYISFVKHPIADYTDVRDFTVDGVTFVRDIATRHRRVSDPAAFVRDVSALLESVPPENLAHGHDLTAFLAALAGGPLGAGGSPDQAAIEMALRAAYTPWEFRSTELFRELDEWGRGNVIIVTDPAVGSA